jgi:hypothetical protein
VRVLLLLHWVFSRFLLSGCWWLFFFFMVGAGEGGMTCARPVGNRCRRAPAACPILPDGEAALPYVVAMMLTAFLPWIEGFSVDSCSWSPSESST